MWYRYGAFITYLSLLIPGLFIAGCKVGPNFHTPAAPQTQRYTEKSQPNSTIKVAAKGGDAQHFISGADIPGEWWLLFHSSALDELVCQGIKNSPTMEAAQAAIRVAEENWYAAMGPLFPGISGSFTPERQRFNTAIFGQPVPQISLFNLYSASVSLSYMLDVFGGIRRNVEAMHAQVDYQRYELAATYLTLTANIATTAVTEAALRGQIRATKSLVNLQEDQLKIVKQQLHLGGVAMSNVLSQQTQLAQLRATLPPLEKNLAQIRNSLAVLVGSLPSQIQVPDFDLDSFHLPTQLPVSLPSTVVRQRPDVLAAEALLHKASAQIGVVTANLLPQFGITAGYGNVSNTLDNLFTKNAVVWNIAGSITQPLFQGGALIAQRRAAIAAYEQAAAQYKQTVLKAFQNIADALKAIEIDAHELQAQVAAEKAARATMQLTQKQFRLGAVNYLSLLSAEQQYQQTIISRIQAQAARYTDTVVLFQALGGGWWNQEKQVN